MDIEKAKRAYMEECNKVGALPRFVSYMTYDQYSEQYTLGNTTDGDVADLQPNGAGLRMHWNAPK